MFCPNCGDVRGNIEPLCPSRDNYHCPVCGHCFHYELRPRLEAKYGTVTVDIWGDDTILPGYRYTENEAVMERRPS